MTDDGARLVVYRAVAEDVTSACDQDRDRWLVNLLRREPVVAVSDIALVAFIDMLGGTGQVHRLAVVAAMDPSLLAAQRCREWSTLARMAHGDPVTPGELLRGSHWFQRRAIPLASPDTLTLLAAHGRTQRVRTHAAARFSFRTSAESPRDDDDRSHPTPEHGVSAADQS